jgi:MYXO-CTERM domain-containing protein
VRGRSCADETDTVAWYDWTDEVAPGAPYGDLVKKVRIEAPRGTVRAALLDGSGAEVADADLEDGGDGTTRILVRRSPVLVMARPGGWVEPEPVPEEVAAPDETADVAEEAQAGGGSGGCGAGASPASLAWPLLALAAILVRRRRA